MAKQSCLQGVTEGKTLVLFFYDDSVNNVNLLWSDHFLHYHFNLDSQLIKACTLGVEPSTGELIQFFFCDPQIDQSFTGTVLVWHQFLFRKACQNVSSLKVCMTREHLDIIEIFAIDLSAQSSDLILHVLLCLNKTTLVSYLSLCVADSVI